ncbi:DEAD/DEAH box helicase family protein [Bacillus sp. EAC]|uniref:DEAD/DEAH box helicase family protein n=1 Tax=Bacillus sp. EAC TaxID=1978338 RepID=UPI000B42D7E9|nr:DEAD/DEAH box helicase family protein [Bacillus sp. EAC]
MGNFLYEKFDTLREVNAILGVPTYIKTGLSENIELREYQKEAFENFITYYNNSGLRKNKQLHLLFHMATGSGKTLMMAGLILYLYKQGYRNFLFFVNMKNIVEKTKENFLNKLSPKYLFNEIMEIDCESVSIKEVSNFQRVDGNDINICFTTTQKLHMDLLAPKENSITISDFEDTKVVLISDESHHVNTRTKKGKSDIEEEKNWEYSVDRVFSANKDNIMLEFTATCDLKDPNVLTKYVDKIIFDYPLAKFRASGYTKDFKNMQSDYDKWERTLIAMVLSQYRLKLFEDIKQPTKPVILLKSQKIEESKDFYKYFFEKLSALTGAQIAGLNNGTNKALSDCFEYLDKKGITYDMLAAELKTSFAEDFSIIMNGETDNSVEKQLAVNTLESKNNPYRIIFTVDMLNEGWDVLNLFDIVRLYETRQSSGKKVSPYTIKEAQLIGRGARYCPFKENSEQEKYKRKYDDDLTSAMRICETMFYHSKQDSRYIDELRKALEEIGLLSSNKVEVEYTIKDSFKNEELYKTGYVFANKKIEVDRSAVTQIDNKVKALNIAVDTSQGASTVYDLFSKNKDGVEVKKTKHEPIRLKDIEYSIAFASLCNFEELKFNKLKSKFPNLKSSREFITSDDYLGKSTIILTSNGNMRGSDLSVACNKLYKEVATHISSIEVRYKGTFEFVAKKLHNVVKNKTRYIENPHGDGEGISQNNVSADMQLDLSTCDWYVFNDNYGTTEEKKFVKYFSHIVDALKKKYEKVFLIRNERFPELAIYDFDTGERFEPDYILLFQKKNADNYEQQQLFVEPKGEIFMDKDQWKEDFMLRLATEGKAVTTYVDDNEYKVIGLPFYNAVEKNDVFVTALERFYK